MARRTREGERDLFVTDPLCPNSRSATVHCQPCPRSPISGRMRIEALYRYPIKGLSPEPLAEARLEQGGYFPGDRLFAIENGPSGFDPASPVHQPKIKYLMLMRNEKLAQLKTRYNGDTGRLTIEDNGADVLDADLGSEAGQAALSAFFAEFMPGELRGAPKLLEAPDGYRFTDVARSCVSLINPASAAAIEDITDRPIDPLRFRGNIHVSGLGAWQEFDLLDQELAIGEEVRLKVFSRIQRCAAIDVDPETGWRDSGPPIAQLLMRQLGHMDCGIYADAMRGGVIRTGDELRVVN